MRRVGVTAATLVLAFTAGGCGGAGQFAHSCGATDRRFIDQASVSMATLGALATGYQNGDMSAREVAQQAFGAASRVEYVKPTDPSLKEAQKLIASMFTEYGDALKLKASGKNAGSKMYRAYGLANFAHDVLAEASPGLAKQGCDVAPLL